MSEPSSFSLGGVAIRRQIGTLTLTVAAIVIGLFFISRLPVDLLPSITYPRIGSRMEVPGGSPEVILEEVTKPPRRRHERHRGSGTSLLGNPRGKNEGGSLFGTGGRSERGVKRGHGEF